MSLRRVLLGRVMVTQRVNLLMRQAIAASCVALASEGDGRGFGEVFEEASG